MESEEVHRLEGSKNEKGGLIIVKKSSPAEDKTFKAPVLPRVSLLGLDKLAGK